MSGRNVLRVLTGVLVALLLTGCDEKFFLSEAELTGYREPLGTSALATSTFSSLNGKLLTIQFAGAVPPRITSTNLLEILRTGTTLPIRQLANRQIDLARLNTELEQQLQTLVRERLNFFQGESSEHVRIEQLNELRIRFLSNPTFSYDASKQVITMNLSIRMTIQGALRIKGVDGWLSRLLVGPVDGLYPMTISMENYRINARAFLSEQYSEAASIRLAVNPTPGLVAVSSPNAPTNIINAVRAVLFLKISRPVDEEFLQRYSNFSITGLRLASTAGAPAQLKVRYEGRPDLAKPLLHVVARGTDNKLYHARKIGTTWTTFSGPLFPTLNAAGYTDPALVSSGKGQMELAATSTGLRSGQLLYAHWRDGSWGDSELLAPSSGTFVGKPAVVASAPGQVEVFVARQLGGLAHLRRVNGRWQQSNVPVPVEPSSTRVEVLAPVYKSPVAALSGTKVVVLFLNSQNRMRAAVFDLETSQWAAPQLVTTPEAVQFPPSMTSSGDARLDVVYVGTSGSPHHFSLSLSYGAIQPNSTGVPYVATADITIGGKTLSAAPIVVATGYRELELIGRAADNGLYWNRFVGPYSLAGFVDGRTIYPGWQGWSRLKSFVSGAPVSTNADTMDGAQGIATAAGTVELISLGRRGVLSVNGTPYLYHNTFDGGRFGHAPWKAVQWRGYERIQRREFRGVPAIAAADMHVEAVFIGSRGNPRQSRLTDKIVGQFGNSSVTGIQAIVTPAAADPAVQVNGAGLVDMVAVNFQGQITHARRRNNAAPIVTVVGSGFQSRPAIATFGHGQLELVALNTNGSLYHYRYIHGVWAAPIILAGTALNAPVLKYTGAGQLELLSVGTDGKLYRRRFANGAWSAAQQIPSAFTVNGYWFGPQSVSSWGDGTLDVIVTSAATDASRPTLYYRRIGPRDDTVGTLFAPARTFASILVGVNPVEIPALAAISPTRLHMVIKGADGSFTNNVSSASPNTSLIVGPITPGADPAIRWSGFRSMGGRGLTLGGVVQTGDELIAAAIDSASRLHINRYSSGAWSGFTRVGGVTSDMLPPSDWPLIRPAIAAYAGE